MELPNIIRKILLIILGILIIVMATMVIPRIALPHFPQMIMVVIVIILLICSFIVVWQAVGKD